MLVRTQMFRYNSYGDWIYDLRDNGETKNISIRDIERDENGKITKVTALKRENGKDIVKEAKQFKYKEIDGKFYVTYRSINYATMNTILEEEIEFIEVTEGKYDPNFFTLRKYVDGELVGKDSRYPDGKFEHIVYNTSSGLSLLHDSLLYVSIVYDYTTTALDEENVPVPYTETQVTIPDSEGNNNTYEDKYELVSVDDDTETYKLTKYKNGEKIEPEEEYYDTYNRKTKEFIKFKGSDKETRTTVKEYTDDVYGNCKHIEYHNSDGKVFGEFIWSDKYGFVKRSMNGSLTETRYFGNKVKKINSTNFKSDVDRTDKLFLTENTETRDKLGRVVMVEYLSTDKSNDEERYKACSHALYFFEGNSLNASKMVTESEIEYYEYDDNGTVKFITTVSGIDKEMFDFYYNKIINQLVNEGEEDE